MLKKIIIGIVCLAAAACLWFGGKYLYDTVKYRNIISDIVISTPDISQIRNGTFHGTFDAILVSADVDVTVDNHIITKIEINKHKTERGAKAESVAQEVILLQSLEIDAVSGATNSSKVILKAIENALENAME